MCGSPKAKVKADGPPEHSDLDPRLKLLVTAEVRGQIDRERLLLREAAGVAFRVIGLAFAFLIAIFAFFGWRTWTDIRRETAILVKARAEELIQSSDAETGVKQTLNDLVNRTIVNAAMTALTGSPRRRGYSISEMEFRRLTEWLKTEKLDSADFSDVLCVLNVQSEDWKKKAANEFLSEMAYPSSNSVYRWIMNDENKRKAILENFRHGRLAASALKIAQSPDASEDLRVAAVKYVRRLRHFEGVSALMEIVSRPSKGNVEFEALIACAVLAPTSPRVQQPLRELMQVGGYPAMAAAVEIVADLWGSEASIYRLTHYVPGSEKAEEDLGKELLRFAIEHGAFFEARIRMPEFEIQADGTSAEPTSRLSDLCVSMQVPVSEHSFLGTCDVSVEHFAKLVPYWRLLEDAMNANDVPQVRRLLFRVNNDVSSDRVFPLSIRISLGSGSRIVIQDRDGNERTLGRDGVEDVFLVPVSTGRSQAPETISVEYVEPDGRESSGLLQSVNGAEFRASLWTSEK